MRWIHFNGWNLSQIVVLKRGQNCLPLIQLFSDSLIIKFSNFKDDILACLNISGKSFPQFLHNSKYRIRPNYRTVRSGFSKLLRTLICGIICIYLLRIHYKKDQKGTYLMMTMPFFLIFLIKAYVVGTHLNCIDKSMQFK